MRAPAKLNLSLLIAGKRPDGFHEIETVMAKVDWYDEIRIEPAGKPGIEFFCEGPRWAPQDQTNLVYRAAELILRESGQARQRPADPRQEYPRRLGIGLRQQRRGGDPAGPQQVPGPRTGPETGWWRWPHSSAAMSPSS